MPAALRRRGTGRARLRRRTRGSRPRARRSGRRCLAAHDGRDSLNRIAEMMPVSTTTLGSPCYGGPSRNRSAAVEVRRRRSESARARTGRASTARDPRRRHACRTTKAPAGHISRRRGQDRSWGEHGERPTAVASARRPVSRPPDTRFRLGLKENGQGADCDKPTWTHAEGDLVRVVWERSPCSWRGRWIGSSDRQLERCTTEARPRAGRLWTRGACSGQLVACV
jgi:hypothetical protein